jgi:hypothetical protein
MRDRDKEAEQDYWDNHPKEKKLITIKVEGGCVVDVENMPKGYKYRVDDADLENYYD